MKAALAILALLITASSTLLAQEQTEGEALVKMHHCYPCHALEQPLIGPPFRAIAARHEQNRELMSPVLAEKIRRGGGGSWGVVPMVPNEQVSPKDARKLASWILGLQDQAGPTP